MRPPSISAVIPMYNEADYVGRCLSAVVAACRDVTEDFEVVVVNDASTDATEALVKKFAEKVPEALLLDEEMAFLKLAR